MNNYFYILPNEEGYLVKSHDTNSEIALFRSRRDAEVFISTLTLSPTPSFSNNYPTEGTPIPQYSSQPQQIITLYPTNGVSPQVFFIQQPASAQQVTSPPYPYYPMMPPGPPMWGTCHGMYPNYYVDHNNYGPGCTCGHNNTDYNEHFEKKFQANEKDNLKQTRDNAGSDLQVKKNNDLKEEVVIVAQANNGYSGNQNELPFGQSAVEQYNPEQNNEFLDEPAVEQQYNGIPVMDTVSPTASVFQQANQEQITNNQPYYEQAFVSNPVFLNQQARRSQAPPINLADDEFFNFVNNENFNNNSKISKKENKRLIKEELKAEKMQAKLAKQNHKKAKRKEALDIEELDPIVE